MQRQFHVPPNGELHIHSIAPLTITLKPPHDDGTQGTAEINGAELASGILYAFEEGTNFSIFSSTGCSLIVEGDPSIFDYLFVDTLGAAFHRSLLDLHFNFAMQRRKAKQHPEGPTLGPCVLVCGTSSDAGKSSVARTLANYSVRLGYQPMYLDLDVTSPSVGMPSCISVFNLQYPLDEESRSYVPGQYVYVGSAKNVGMFRDAIQSAIAISEQRWSQGDRTLLGGLFGDYPTLDIEEIEAAERLAQTQQGSVLQPSQFKNPIETLVYTLQKCYIDTLVIVGSSWLKYKLLALYGNDDNSILLPEGGVVSLVVLEQPQGAIRRSEEARIAVVQRYWTRYFSGSPNIPLRSSVVEVPSENIWVLRILSGSDDDSLQSVLSIDHAHTELGVVRETHTDLKAGTPLALIDAFFTRYNGSDPYHVDATFETIAEEEVYNNIRLSRRVLGVAVVEGANKSSVSLRLPCALLPRPTGCCFVIFEEHLQRSHETNASL